MRILQGELTDKISKACKAVYRDLANNGAWGLSALSKMPGSGLDFDNMSEDDKRKLNNLLAMLYHGVGSEEAVLMRMNSVPRSIAESAGDAFKTQLNDESSIATTKQATDYLKSLKANEWGSLRPNNSIMSGDDYQRVWKKLSGL